MPVFISMHNKGLDFFEERGPECVWTSALAMLGYSTDEIRARAHEIISEMKADGKQVVLINQLVE